MGGGLDWSTEWFTSIVWILGVFVAAAIGSAVLIAIVTRVTTWGRQFARLAFPYFSPRGSAGWRPLLTALLLLLLSIAAVRLNVLLSYQGNAMLTSLQQQDQPAFWQSIVIFLVLATIHLARYLLTYYVQQLVLVEWRVWLNEDMLGDWLGDRVYHRGRFTAAPVDNPDQRIQEDIASYPATSIGLGVGAVSSLVSLVSFTIILWELSGPLPVFGIEVPRGMTFIVYLFVIIAFHRGETVERDTLMARFSAIISNYWDRVFRTLKLDGFNVIVTQAAEVIPYVIQAPRFFAGQITLGDVTQTGSAFGQVHDSLSFFRNAYTDFAAYRAVLDRLTGLLDANAAARKLPNVDVEEGEALEVRDLTVSLPEGRTLVDDLDLSLTAGQTLLVTGASGVGKTTLLRSIADLWPYATGVVRRLVGDGALFVSQQPYVPLGSLRTALTYPQPAGAIDDAAATEVLRKVQLAHLADRIDDETDWSRVLSPGEQQRLGFARVLIARPRVIFLDEATSALDEGLEHALYTMIRDELPEAIVVSVGHRSSLKRLHAEQLELLGEGRWQTADLQA